MLTKSQKVSYLIDSVLHYGSPVVCPSCGGSRATLVDRKYMVTRLFECDQCKLYFRHPSDSAEVNKQFYQQEYMEGDGITTYMPSQAELEELKKMDFSTDSNKNAERLRTLFGCLFPDLNGVKILDYGASWGYVSYQFRAFGMNVESYEISVPRASFGNQSLGLRIHTSERDLRNGNDIFFSSHVIEHVPSPGRMLDLGKKLLHKDGYLVTICPNGSPEYRAKDPEGFHAAWGKVHPNYLNAAFFQNKFKNCPYFITTSPFDFGKIAAWDKRSQVVDSQLENEEILVIARPNV
jgi:hypothetical protein